MAKLIGKAIALVARCVNFVSAKSLLKDFTDVFKDELRLLREELKSRQLHPDSTPTEQFHLHSKKR